jgi:hypothetical protein
MSDRVWSGDFGSARAVFLENDVLRAVALPDHGGKIASLFYKPRSFELLFQNPRPRFEAAFFGADFGAFEACGFDDVFPSVEVEEVQLGPQTACYPDHGEIWFKAMETSLSGEKLELRCEGAGLPFSFSKTVRLDGRALILQYCIENTADLDFPYVFLAHCLVSIRPGMSLLIPRGTGPRAPVASGPGMGKWYLQNAVPLGVCGYRFPAEGLCALFRYDPRALPYLGFWWTEGGYRGDHNCALEPASAYYDAVGTAALHRRESVLPARGALTFSIALSFEDFPINLEHLEEVPFHGAH